MKKAKEILEEIKQTPKCIGCMKDLPTLNGMMLVGAELEDAGIALESVTFHIRCLCGQRMGLNKVVGQ